MNFEAARINMVESQVRPNGITDDRILNAMSTLPRELFVPQDKRNISYMDEDITVFIDGTGQRRVLLEPMALARLLQLAEIKKTDYVLDIGCATGYSSAVLACLAQSVVAIDAESSLVDQASDNFMSANISNAVAVQADHTAGLAGQGPYDLIFINGRLPSLPSHLAAQLKPGGRLVAVHGNDATAHAVLGIKSGDDLCWREEFSTPVSLLPGFAAAQSGFVF